MTTESTFSTTLEDFICPETKQILRTFVDQNGDPWFLTKDVLTILGLTNATKACANLEDQEKSYLNRIQLGLNPGRPFIIISESGLYKLVMRSNKREAKKFQDWVTKVVLPSIRKHGGYTKGQEALPREELVSILHQHIQDNAFLPCATMIA